MRICMVSYSFFENDARVMLYTNALLRRGDRVDVICLGDQKERMAVVDGATCYRVQDRVVDEKGRLSYLFRLLKFFFRSLVRLTLNHLEEPYALIHVHSIPDTQVFATFFAKAFGKARVILDIHDLLPELFTNKFDRTAQNHFLFKTLLAAEKASVAFADHVIVPNHLWKKKVTERSAAHEKCSVVMNYPDFSVFYPRPRVRTDGKFIIIYPGTLNYHQGLDIAIRAFSRLRNVRHAEFHIWGRGEEKERLDRLIWELSLTEKIFLHGFCPIKEVVRQMADADLCVVPKRDDGFGGEAFSTKIFEFMSLGVPLLISATRIDKYYFNEDVVEFFRPGDEKDLASSMLLLINDRERRERLVANACRFVQEYDPRRRMVEYLSLVDRLTGNGVDGLKNQVGRTIHSAN